MVVVDNLKPKARPFTSTYDEKRIFKPLFRFAKLCAINTGGTRKLNSRCCWHTFYAIALLSTLVTLCIWSIINKCMERENYSNFCVFLFEIVTVLFLTFFSVSVIINSAFVKQKRIKALLANLVELDYLMGKDGGKLFKRRQRILTFQLIVIHLCLFSTYTYDIFSNVISFDTEIFIFKIPDYVNEYIMAIEVLCICNYTLSIKYKLTALNTSLVSYVKSFLDNVSTKELYSVTAAEPPALLTVYLEAHNKLCNIIDSFNDCFGFQIFEILFIGVIHTTYTLFLLLIYASGKAKPSNDTSVVYILVVYIYFCLIFMAFGIMVTIFCTTASRAARRTATICYKLLLNISVETKLLYERSLRKELLLFAEQVSQRQVKFSAGGFLTIDYNTLYNLFGSTAMNVIILLQFQKQTTLSN